MIAFSHPIFVRLSLKLDRAANERPAVLDPGLYRSLTELKGFRHLLRHRYGLELDPVRVAENVQRVRSTFAASVEAVVTLEQRFAR
ncbi:hypothetical protein NPA31_009415 [Aurantimonas sp. MSK8Z-1]|uniref:ribonuclease toxin HepT-like protein n=1 Tax=Mangrovibrevibacter kandeliae TaxID=2968473 RepID=UPI00211937CE|nr:hypothetical protein [Aurantimonas sp. MSK8Z-1]MCW4115175.1 hypothetical protein [Aurantimonas sp. MSK8Z-1]